MARLDKGIRIHASGFGSSIFRQTWHHLTDARYCRRQRQSVVYDQKLYRNNYAAFYCYHGSLLTLRRSHVCCPGASMACGYQSRAQVGPGTMIITPTGSSVHYFRQKEWGRWTCPQGLTHPALVNQTHVGWTRTRCGGLNTYISCHRVLDLQPSNLGRQTCA